MLLVGLAGAVGGTSATGKTFAQFDPTKVFKPGPIWEDADKSAEKKPVDPPDAPGVSGTFRATGGPPATATEGEGEAGGAAKDKSNSMRAETAPGARKLPTFSSDTTKPVIVIPVEGTIDLGLSPFIDRVVKEAGDSGAAAVVLDINTFGGRVDAAVRIKDALLSSTVPTIAFINRRAISAGALISLACDVIGVTSGATMGAATPVQMGGGGGGEMKPVAEKVVSYMRKEMRSTAEAKDRDGDLAEAMVDADNEIEGLAPKGKLLTLTTREGLQHGVFDREAETLEALLAGLGLQDHPVHRVKVNWAERVARTLTDPTVSGMLMTFGFLGLMMELYTAGFGITGIIGLSCLFMFFMGHVVADLAGFEELLLFFLGIAMIIAEGFGLGGGTGLLAIAGLSAVIVSLVMALIEAPIEVSWGTGDIASALQRVAFALGVTLFGGIVMSRMFPKTKLFRRIVLDASLGGADAGVPDLETADGDIDAELVGARGVTVTYLRPFGKARINDRKIEVTTEGGFLEAGKDVRVVRIEGRNVVVREVAAELAPDPASDPAPDPAPNPEGVA